MRFGFVTCVGLGLSCMEEIDAAGGHLDLVVTLRDELAPTKSGRVRVDDFCEAHGAELVKVANINDPEAIDAMRAAGLDWLFIIGWSQIASPAVLEVARKGVLGMHPTLLPVGRGRASIPWAILKGLPQTGITLFKLDQGIDTGPILAAETLEIAPDETATTLYERVSEGHRRLIRRAWPDLEEDIPAFEPQDERLATTWPGRSPEDGRISADMSLAEVERLVRAVTHPYPGAFWPSTSGRRLRVWAGSLTRGSGPEIRLRGGSYFATDYEWETNGV